MKLSHAFLVGLTLLPGIATAQVSPAIVTQDITNFWVAYDSIGQTTDRARQLALINRLYIDKGSAGLKAFLRNKENPDQRWVDLMQQDRRFWEQIRPRTQQVIAQAGTLRQHIAQLQRLYPALKEAGSYFIIGFRQQGGTVRNNLSIIGTEVVLESAEANAATLAHLCVHEYVHTQQARPNFQTINVLTSAIREGACDFIAEQVLKQPLKTPYLQYGYAHEVAVWRVFKQDMLTQANNLWVSTGHNPALPASDLGYYVGHAICNAYYQAAPDKQQAIRAIIELDYANPDAVADFLKKSNYENLMVAKGYNPAERLPVVGFVLSKSQAAFFFNPADQPTVSDDSGEYRRFDPATLGKATTVSLVGDFNNWDIADSTYQLKKDTHGVYNLIIDKARLGKPGEPVRFRFVINHKWGVQPLFASSNRTIDNDGNACYLIPR
jgi:hypothetical protein